jgi:catechol 2,3-dioxygenase-like lactoylglutathione lyase family enzyme
MKVFDHLTINYQDYKKYLDFYTEALDVLKCRKFLGEENLYVGFGVDKATFWISLSDHQHLETRNLHISFVANNFEQVQKFYDIAIKHGLNDNGKPGFRPEYHENYFACFVLDDQGNNIECVFRDKTEVEEFEISRQN